MDLHVAVSGSERPCRSPARQTPQVSTRLLAPVGNLARAPFTVRCDRGACHYGAACPGFVDVAPTEVPLIKPRTQGEIALVVAWQKAPRSSPCRLAQLLDRPTERRWDRFLVRREPRPNHRANYEVIECSQRNTWAHAVIPIGGSRSSARLTPTAPHETHICSGPANGEVSRGP